MLGAEIIILYAYELTVVYIAFYLDITRHSHVGM